MERSGAHRTSVCPSCAVGCRLGYDDVAGEATAPDNTDGSINHALCPAGIRAFDSPDDRLTEPMIRRDGELVPVTWNEAYDRIERGFAGRVSDSLAFLGSPHATNEENYLFQKIARGCGTNNIDNRARLCHNSVEIAMNERLGTSAMTNSLADLREAAVFLVIGANPAARQPIAFEEYIRPAIADGATLVHVDIATDNRTAMAADYTLTPASRDGADTHLLTLLCKFVLASGGVDERFVRERTTGFEEFAASLETLDPDACAGIAGVRKEAVREVAETIAHADRVAAITATGLGACERDGTQTSGAADALLDLLLFTGNIGKPGTGMNLFRGMNNEQGANDMGARPHTLPGYRDVTDPEAREDVTEIWGTEPPTSPGRTEKELVREFGEAIQCAFVFGENPAVAKRDGERITRGLETMAFLVVQDPVVTETVAHADVVLPASRWMEKSGTVTNLERRVQRMYQLASPPEHTKTDLAILCELGARLTDLSFSYDGPEGVFEEMKRITPIYAGMDYNEIERGGIHWPCPNGSGETESETHPILHRSAFFSGEKRACFEPVKNIDAN